MMLEALGWCGRQFLRLFVYPLTLFGFLYTSVEAVVKERAKGHALFLRSMILQVYFTGFHAPPVATLSAAAVGSVIMGNAIFVLDPIGQMKLAAEIIPLTIIREVGPIIVTLIIIGRSGTAVTTELGNMVVNREIRVLDILGIDVKYIIVFPRIVGITIGVVALAVYFFVFAMVGGFLIVRLMDMAPMNFTLSLLLSNIQAGDIVVSILKCVCIGFTVSVIHCYHGLSVRRSSTEVPQQTTKAVVNSIVYCFLINGIIFALTFSF